MITSPDSGSAYVVNTPSALQSRHSGPASRGETPRVDGCLMVTSSQPPTV